MTRIGFTGSREGMTLAQAITVHELLSADHAIECIIHGDCLGADAEFHDIAKALSCRAEVRPCTISHMRAHRGEPEDLIFPVKSPLDRNKDIVNTCSVMIACPATTEEQLRSGTWSTIRYATKIGRHIKIVWPDGSITERNHG